MRVIVCGGRAYANVEHIHKVLQVLKMRAYISGEELVVLHGACPTGADAIAERWALAEKVRCIAVQAKWDLHGKKAGPLRNSQMLSFYEPDLVVAFPTPGGANRGTNDMVRQAERKGVPVRVIR